MANLPHVRGRQWSGKKLKLRKWQREPLENIFGVLNEDGTRKYRMVYWEIPKKNSKSTIAAGVSLYLLFADGEMGAEVYSAASDREQASIVFNIARDMVNRTPQLKRRARVLDSRKTIRLEADAGSLYRAVEREAASQHGYNVHGLIFDEFHTQRTSDLFNTLHEGTAARVQPLTFIITTAGYDRESICWKYHEYALDVIKGTIEDPTFYPIVYSAVDPDEDPQEVNWQDERRWYKANPALGDFLPIEQMRDSARRAAEIPSEQNEFMRLRENIWTQQWQKAIPLAKWDACKPGPGEDALKGRRCYGGLDLGAVNDLTAWAMVFPDDDDPELVDVVLRCWCPEARLYAKDNVYRKSYQAWVKQGWLVATPGEATDYGFVRRQIIEDSTKFDLFDAAVDRQFQAHQLSMELIDEGIDMVGMGQGFLSMASPTREFEERVTKQKIRHGKNPLLRWSVDSYTVKFDDAGNMKPTKKDSAGKIDPVVALLMAIERAMVNTNEGAPQEARVLPALMR